MAKKKRKVETIHIMDSLKATMVSKPHYDAHAIATGEHKSVKYATRNSKSTKRENHKIVREFTGR